MLTGKKVDMKLPVSGGPTDRERTVDVAPEFVVYDPRKIGRRERNVYKISWTVEFYNLERASSE